MKSRLSRFWQSRRASAIVMCVLAGTVAVWVVVWPLTDLVAAHDVGTIVSSAQLQSAREAVRTQLLTLGAGLFAFAALIYTARNYTLSREGHLTDRYMKAIEMLGSAEMDVRIGGIYALERIARDSPRDHPTVIKVLCVFAREHSRVRWTRSIEIEPGQLSPKRRKRPDVDVALNVIGHRNHKNDRDRIELYGANFANLTLRNAWLEDSDFTSANLMHAFLSGTDFAGAWLPNANLIRARLDRANLANAWMSRANLRKASLIGAALTNAKLDGAILADAVLFDAKLDGADFTGSDLTGAVWPADVPLPAGWKRKAPPDDMKLSRINSID